MPPTNAMSEPVSPGPQPDQEAGPPGLGERVHPPLREAVVEQYAVFALHFAGEAAGDRERLAPVRATARHLSHWLGVDLLAEAERQTDEARWPQRGQATQVCWIPYHASLDGAWAGFLHVQARNDTLLVQIVYGRPGEADEAIFRRLCAAVWSPPANDPHFLGQTLCFGGIVEDAGCATSWAEEALSLCRAPQVPETEWAPAGLRCLDLGYAWLFDHPQAPDALALFYPDEAGEQAASARLFNAALPELLLHAHKAIHQFQGYEAALRAELAAAERSLAEALDRASPPATDVSELERQLKQVALAYDDFARRMSRFEGVQQTVRLNVGNFEAALARHELPARGPLAGLQATVRRTLQQMEADEVYYRSAVERAGITLATLQVQADIERAHLEQEETRQAERRNLLLGFIGMVLALGQIATDGVVLAFLRWLLAFFGLAPVDPAPAGIIFWVKLALVLGAGVAGIGLAWALGRLWRGPRSRS